MFSKLINLGLSETHNLSFTDQRKVQITNTASIFIILLSLVSIIIDNNYNYIYIGIIVPVIIVAISSLILTQRGSFIIAHYLQFITTLIVISFLPKLGSFYFWPILQLLNLMAYSLLLFRDQKIQMLFFITSASAFFINIYIAIIQDNTLLQNTLGFWFNTIAFIIVFFCILKVYQDESQKYQQTVEQKNQELSNQYALINDSINYAQRIQQATLPTSKLLHASLPEHFLLFRPLGVVSGDFYWINNYSAIDGKVVVASIDCTGHGVPGAFMSLIANDLLNNIVNERRILEADQILNQLHIDVVAALRQTENDNEDGMDMSLLVIDYHNRVVEFAGAKNPVFYVQQNNCHQIKGDRLPIGGRKWGKERSFKKHIISIEHPTNFYLFSDGYQDQFGGPKNKKFMRNRLYNTLKDNAHLPLLQQRNLLEQTLLDWQQDQEQVDDILVIGLRV